ncbi:MAG: COX15/CtaA family protein [Pseudomonadota bacterium]
MSLGLTLQLAILALIVAMLPLSLVWAAADKDRYRKLIAVTVFLTFDLIVFGAFTRLTDSGLGCPDWPGCYGQANPLQAHAEILAAQTAMPTGPVTVAKAWIEMIHRYMAMAVGVLIVSLMVLAWRRWWQQRQQLQQHIDGDGNQPASTAAAKSTTTVESGQPWFATMLFGFVCLQGAFGAWTVTLKLQPLIVTVHLLMGMGLLGLLAWLHAQHRLGQALPDEGAAALRWPALLAAVLLAVQIALGGWVSTNYATLACTDFPLCQGTLVPPMDYAEGFTLWRKLGMTASGEYLPFPALTAIHWVHRNSAFVVVAVLGWVGWRALAIPSLRRTGTWLLVGLGTQFATGVATVYLEWPLALAVAHNAGAALLVLLLTMLNYRTFAAHLTLNTTSGYRSGLQPRIT